MTTGPSAVRLDEHLWAPSPLGTLGPHGLLQDATYGGQMSYRPLLSYHLADGPLTDGLDRAVTRIDHRDELQAVLEDPAVARWCPPSVGAGDPARWEQDRKVAVVLRDRGGDQFQALLVAGHGGMDEAIAHLSTFWVPNAAWLHASGVDDVLAAGWLALFRGLAEGGAVGVTATEIWSGRDFVEVLRRIAGFRPAAELYAELGLSPADSKAVLVEWRATVEDQRVVRFATRPDLDATAERTLMRLLDRYFTAAPARDEPASQPTPGERFTFRGEVAIDGVRGWGTGPQVHDWFEPPPDHVPAGAEWPDADARALAGLVAWLRDQAS
jgi:hypothetical protein